MAASAFVLKKNKVALRRIGDSLWLASSSLGTSVHLRVENILWILSNMFDMCLNQDHNGSGID